MFLLLKLVQVEDATGTELPLPSPSSWCLDLERVTTLLFLSQLLFPIVEEVAEANLLLFSCCTWCLSSRFLFLTGSSIGFFP